MKAFSEDELSTKSSCANTKFQIFFFSFLFYLNLSSLIIASHYQKSPQLLQPFQYQPIQLQSKHSKHCNMLASTILMIAAGFTGLAFAAREDRLKERHAQET